MSFSTLIIDTETHALNGYPIEIAYVPIEINQSTVKRSDQQLYDEYFSLDANTQISLASMAVHHILPKDIEGKPHFSQFRLPSETVYLIGHNIDYDVQAIARCGQVTKHIKPICTLALARSIWPQLEGYSLSTLSYFISNDFAATREQLRDAHNAKADILITASLLSVIVAHLNVQNIEQLFELSQKARLPQFMPFGKYKGTALTEVPIDYIQWLLRQQDLDPYLREALEQIF